MDISTDSRHIKPGQYFIPIKGENFDGRDYIPEVIKKGGRILDVNLWDYAKKYRKKLNCTVIGITGSAGKTTAKDMLASILGQSFKVVKTEENNNNEIGAPLTVLKADAQTDILIVEMGMCNKGDIKFLTQIVRPTHSLITNIGLTHLELMKTQRRIACGKAEIFQKRQQWEQPDRFAFLNYATPYYDLLVKKAEQADYKILPFGGDNALAQAHNMCYTIGRHFGLSDKQIQMGIDQFNTSSHRLKTISLGSIRLVDDTYNANPNGVEFALQHLSQHPSRKILVIGDMLELGKQSKACHRRIVNQAVEAGVSIIFAYGTETQVMTSKKDVPVYHFDNKDELQKQLLFELKANDCVLVKGSRSMRMETIVEAVQQQYA